jgi:5-methylcytosine-specific restriction endonuclease McrA
MQTDKICKSCGLSKPVDDFAKNGKSGRHPRCKPCKAEVERDRRLQSGDLIREQDRKRYNENREAKARSIRKYYQANRDSILARNAKLYESKAESIKAGAKSYRKANREKVRAWNGTRRAALRNACPAWADKKAIAAKYREAIAMEMTTGIAHHVDHIIPLAGAMVCGLHVVENLAVIPAGDNLRKGMKYVAFKN